jgi:glutamyl-tRNA reductase
MSVDGETLSAITGMEEACATARARVEDLVAELDGLRRCLRSVITQRDEARAEVEQLKAQHLERHLERWEQYMQDNDVRRAYRRGAEAMREAAAHAVHDCHTTGLLSPAAVTAAVRVIRALPIPGES